MEDNRQARASEGSNGQVLAIASGVSAVAAAAVAGIGRVRQQQHQPSGLEALRETLAESSQRHADAAKERAGGVSKRAQVEARKGKAQASKALASAPVRVQVDGDRARDLAASARGFAVAGLAQAQSSAVRGGSETSESVRKHVASTKQRARGLSKDAPRLDLDRSQKQAEAIVEMASKSLKSARKNASPALDSVRERAPLLAGTVAGTANDRINQVAEYAAELAGNARSRADRADLSGITASVRPAGESVKDTFSRLKEDVAPVARDAAVQAAAAAIQLWEATREQTADLNAKDLQQASSHLYSDLSHRAKEASAAVASTATAVTQHATEDLAERSEEARDRAEYLMRRAATATAETSKDATSALVWAGIAGGLIYYGLLDEAQRSRVDSAARSIYAGVTELVRDIQGYDADF